MSALIDLAGKTFGRLTVKYRDGTKNNHAIWMCRCQCGKSARVTSCNLLSGNSSSCGCLKNELDLVRTKTHGLSTHPEYHVWRAMIQRCVNPNCLDFKYYGGRGIKVCERWKNSFMDFRADVGSRPFPKATIDRYPDKNGHYEPGNVRWATRREQMRNNRKNRILVLGDKALSIAEWADELGIAPDTIRERVNLGWSIEKALTTPVRLMRKA